MTSAPGLSEAEWEGLYRRLERPLYNVAYRYVWNSQEAQDLLHDAFLQLWSRRGGVMAVTADRYLWTCVLNMGRKRRRWKQLRRLVRVDDDVGGRASLKSVEMELVDLENQSSLQRAIEALPDKLRGVLLLTAFSELSYDAIAEMLSIPAGTVASRRHLALKQLRQTLRSD